MPIILSNRSSFQSMGFPHTHTCMHAFENLYIRILVGFYNLELLQSDFAGTDVFIMVASGVKEKNNRILTCVSQYINEEL